MKALAARGRDVDDLRILAARAGVESLDDALRECAHFYPNEQPSVRSVEVLRDLFEPR